MRRYWGGAGTMLCDVRRPAGIHHELVLFQAVQIWKKRPVFA
ncbi:hypothetical protein [Gimesia maris]|nr:hypothetical protein [Gimesia maris]EDL60892.1 hypothetical protein PM8797T_09239 [Gimesia maris DSM 8797]